MLTSKKSLKRTKQIRKKNQSRGLISFVLKKISGLDILIEGEETAAISYPNFYEDFENLL